MAKKKKETAPGLFDKPKTAQELKLEGVQNLYNFLFEACNILRGPVSQDNFKDYITPILYYKRISDVYDERPKRPSSRVTATRSMLLFPSSTGLSSLMAATGKMCVSDPRTWARPLWVPCVA